MILFRVLWSIFKMAAGIDAEFKMAAVSEADVDSAENPNKD